MSELGVGKSLGVSGKIPVGSGLPIESLWKLQDSVPPSHAGTPELKTEREREKPQPSFYFEIPSKVGSEGEIIL